MSTFLQDKGIPVHTGYDPANLTPPPDLVVVGNVIRRDNPRPWPWPKAACHICRCPRPWASCSSPERHPSLSPGPTAKPPPPPWWPRALEHAGKPGPGFMVGGHHGRGRAQLRATLAASTSSVEGDEYDTAFFDKRPKFVHYRPKVGHPDQPGVRPRGHLRWPGFHPPGL